MKARLFVHVLLILVLGLLLSGCGDDTSTTTPSDESSVEATDQTAADTEEAVAEEADTDTSLDAAQTEDAEVVVYVNGSPGYSDAFATAYDSIYSTYYELYAQFGMDIANLLEGADGLSFRLSLESQALERVILEVVVHDEAEARGVSVSEDEVDAEFSRQYAEYLESLGWTDDEFRAYVESVGMTFDEFKGSVIASIEWQLLLDVMQEEIAGPIEPTDEELQTYFDENVATYSTEEQVMASHILVSTQTEAETLLAELDAGADFPTLAQEHSLDTGSAAAGGSLGWFGRGMMVEEFEDAAFATEVGTYSSVVESDYGFHIILVEDHQDAHTPTLDEVIEQVTADFIDDRQFELLETWYDEVYAAADIDVQSPLLAAYRYEASDIDAAIAAYEELLDEDSVDEPYLAYYIGTLYESLLSDAETIRENLLGSDEITEETEQQIQDIEALIEEYRSEALERYQQALDAVGEDADIQLRIEGLQVDSAGTTDETDSE